MRNDLPSGTVTFLFTDVEGSTKLLHSLGAEEYAEALAEHRRVIREACAHYDGVEVDTQGDAFFFAFPTAPGALSAAEEMTQALSSGPIHVRVGLHTGTPLLTDEGYVGDDLHFGARVAASSHGGQVVLSSATAELVELSLTDLGEHRLKDIEDAVSIFQLGDGSFPPLKTISNTNLPRPASSFVGRDAELAEVLSRIEQGARLVTLTGPGGTGKTRLGLEAASSLVPSYKAGVFWVGLATIRDPALVLETIAQTLGAKDGLAGHIAEREMLLLLDNLEQVIEVAPELSSLLIACPNLTLLVTSRELLRVQGEVEYPVPPLAAPEAVSLFCERAQAEPTDEIAELCTRLDSLPLAVELAAARVKALSPAQILERLSSRLDLLQGGRDADPRQLTLRATIEWSYDLLSPEEQQLFARLSVFAGGCTLEAAEEVADAHLDTLQSLVEKSLLRFTNGRYWMLETIREYAGERLKSLEEADELMRRHAGYFHDLGIARAAKDEIENHFEELEAEHDNVRAALVALHRLDPVVELELAVPLGRFWYRRSYWREGLARLEEALDARGAPWEVTCAGHAFSSYIAAALHDPDSAEAHAKQQLEFGRRHGSTEEIADALGTLGFVAQERGDSVEAKRLAREALALARESEDVEYIASAAGDLATLSMVDGDFDSAAEFAEEAVALFRSIHSPDGAIAQALIGLSLARLHQGRYADAAAAVTDTSALSACTQYRHLAEGAFEVGGAIASAQGTHFAATKLLAAAAAIREELAVELSPFEAGMHDSVVEHLQARLAPEFQNAWAEGVTLSVGEAVALLSESLD